MKRQILISLLILLFIQTLASAAVLYVPSRDYLTIQSAINAAVNGDVVVVAPGVYTGTGNVDLDFLGKAITVRSEINPDNPNPAIIAATIIDCQGTRYNPHRAFYFRNGEGPDSKVLGFTIRNGYGRGPIGADGVFGYIGLVDALNPIGLFVPIPPCATDDPNDCPPYALNGDNASGNGYGGAILCAGASPTMQYCVISNSTVTGAQGGDGADGLDGIWLHWTLGDIDPGTGYTDDTNNPITENPDGQWAGSGGWGIGNGYGGAIACIGSNPIISDCIISDNFARGGCGGDGGNGGNAYAEPPDPAYDDGLEGGGGDAGDSIGDGIGGGIYSDSGSSPVITNCTFSNNIAVTGIRGTGGERGLGNEDDPRAPRGFDGPVYSTTGGIAGGAAYYSTSSDANFTNCTFTSNKAYEAKRYKWSVPYPPYPGEDISAYTVGGALYSVANNTVTLDSCKFIGNLGGAVYCGTGCNLDFDDCLFSDNSETANGGAVYIDTGCTVNIQSCIFGGNSAYDDGGALKCKSDITLTNCSFGNNIADSDDDDYGYGGAIDAYRPSVTLIIDVNACSFAGNQSVYGGGFSSENFDANFTDCYFIGNTAQRGGGLDLANGGISVTGGVVKGNNATDGDGGGFNCRYTIAEIRDCTISDNFADGVYPAGGSGGAISFYGWAPTQVVFNCLLTDNFATINGGAIFCRNVTPEIGNCTFSDNFASDYGGAIFSDWASDPQITDAIFRNNNSHAIHEEDPSGDALVKYSLFFNNPDGDYYDSGTGMTYSGSGEIGSIPDGSNNLYGDPLFESGSLGEFYLRQQPVQPLPQSPAVDTGSTDANDPNIGLDTYTTRTDSANDVNLVDRGYHYFDVCDVDEFQLTASVIGDHGTVAPTAPTPLDYDSNTGIYTYYAGTVVTLTSEPDGGWRIKAWSGTDDDSSKATTNSVVMNANRDVTVEFELPRILIVALGGGGEGFYVNITGALHDAEDGDTIVVYPGVYYGPQVQVNKDVEIRSQNPDDPNWVEQTIIDSTGHSASVFWFDSGRGPGCILNGFTIQNSTWWTDWGEDGDDPGENGEDECWGGEGGAIWISSGSGPVIKNCLIRDNFVHGGFGGDGADADETHNAGRGGWGGWAYGGAVYCDTNSSPQFINCRIIDNQAIGGIGGNGGDWDPDGGRANYGGNWSRAEWWNRRTDSTQFEWVQGDLWEVWLTTLETDPYIVGPPYIGDYRWYSGYGGGVFIDEGSNVAFINCTISGNLAQGGLSGLGGEEPGAGPDRAKPFPLQYELPSFGGGVYCAADSTVTFTDCTITDNVSSEPLFDHTILVDGFDLPRGWIQAEYDPCDTYSIDPYLGHGGGVCAEDTATVIFTDCTLSGNKAAVGGGIHGGNANLEVSDCEFISNTAYQGGGLFGEHGPATIVRSNFTNNIASSDANDPNVLGEGGGIHFWATEADIIGCKISSNQAEASGGGAYFGGEGTSFLANCLLTKNTAGRDGGGVSANIFTQLMVSNCTIADNIITGVGYGGGVYGSYGNYTNIIDSIIWGNSADFGPQIGIGITVSPSTVEVSYSDVQGAQSDVYVEDDCTLIWDPNSYNISEDPNFVEGYYLSQVAAGQDMNSPCVDVGSADANDPNIGLDTYTTRTDGFGDTYDPNNPDPNSVIVDMGYHYMHGVTQYQLTLTVVDNNGTVEPNYPVPLASDPNSGIYSYYEDNIVTLITDPCEGYRVKKWTGTNDDISTEPQNTVTMTEDKEVTVEFEMIPVYQLYLSVVGNGTVEPNYPVPLASDPPNGIYSYYDGAEVFLVATPNDPNYEIKSWTGTDDDSSRDSNNTVTINDSNADVTVAFGLIGEGDIYIERDLNIFFFATIQGAIDAAWANDVVIVGDGTYTGVGNRDLHFRGIPITVRSENGPENCIIDCQWSDCGFRFSLDEDSIIRDANGVLDINSIPDSNYIVRGFTITHGSADFGGGLYYEGTVDAVGALTASFPAPLVENCIIKDNSATTSGGGVAFNVIVGDPNAPEVPEDAPVPTIANCKIINNTTSLGPENNGGGIFCTTVSPIITGTEISGNSAYKGGGIYSEGDESIPAIINCLITFNWSVDIGGSIYLLGSPAIINLCTVAYNTGFDYGDVDDQGNPIGPKGGITCIDATPVITNCIIGRNGYTDPNVGTWGDLQTYGDDLYNCSATYSCIENSGDIDGVGNINLYPLWTRGGFGDFYLPQVQSGQGIDSNCIDAGEENILTTLQGPPPDGYNLSLEVTTSIKNHFDVGYTDMGYHYPPYDGPPILYRLEINVIGPGSVSPAPGVYYHIPGTFLFLQAFPAADHWGYWYGTDDDMSWNTWNIVSMYDDKNVTVSFEFIEGRRLYVPAEYPTLQDAIDNSRYKDTIELAAAGSDNPYRTSQGFLIRDSKAIAILGEDPNDPATVAATVIEMEVPDPGGYVGRAFTFLNVGTDTVLNGITIRGFDIHALDGIDGEDAPDPGFNGGNAIGSAILCVNASPTIKNCIITDCIATGGDGGNGLGGTTEHPDGGEGGWPGRGYGGGLACLRSSILSNSNPTVINCVFSDCAAIGGNGGDGGNGSDPPTWGKGGRGGGWFYGTNSYWYDVPWPYAYHLHDGPPGFYDFYTEHGGRGGAVYVGEGCSPTFIDCTFTNNRSEGGLSGICGLDGDPPALREEPGLRWKIDNFGGAVYCDDDSSAVFTDCVFNDNVADSNRPIMDTNLPYDPLTNYDNDDLYVGFGGAVAFKYNANVTYDNCRFNSNSGDKGGAAYWSHSDPTIIDCNFVDNSAQSGGGVLFTGGLGTITRCDFSDNEATGVYGRGGAICSLGANALIADCNISRNDADGSGGGIYISSKDADGNDLVVDGNTVFGYNKAVLLNCLITGNIAGEDGGGVSANWDSEPEIVNCTIADNIVTGVGYGGGVYGSYGSYTNIVDSIVWGNSAYYGPQIGIGITASPSTVDVSYSNVQGAQSDVYVEDDCTLIWDPNNLYTDPFFVIGPLGDYYLSQTEVDDSNQTVDSPCVDAGSGSAISVGMSGYTTRTDEVFDRGIVDMGYHHLITLEAEECRVVDLFFDHFINFKDFTVFAWNWLRDDCSDDNGWCDGADLTFDGNVDWEDLGFYIGCWLVVDNDTPVPNPSEWAIEPYSSSLTSIGMAAKTTVDTWGGDVEYYFECVYGDCNDSGWQSDPCYTDDAKGFGLDPNTEYGYRVRAKDSRCGDIGDLNCTFDPNDPNDPNAPNKTDWSDIRYAITSGEEEPPPPPDTTPPSPDPMTFEVYPHATSSTTIAMTATTATDPEDNGVEYYFESDDVNSGWQDSPIWEDTNLAPSTTYTYWVQARDKSAFKNETEWSDPCSATTLAEGEEPPPLQAPVIVGANQVEVGFYWHHVITARATAEDPLYFRFVCLDQSIFNSAWVPRDGNAVDTFDHPVVPEMPDATITRGSDVITYDIAVGVSWNLWQWQVCGSNEEDYDPALCSDPCMPSLPF